jgi:transcriptional regulator with GAF, ATPase, and Fis domain/serine/threonine protein kinase/tetratricopeptide (TPR) repeat protein
VLGRFAGRYELLQHVGRGGMGDVYLARDLTTGDECALKRMHAGVAAAGAAQMEDEFRILAGVRHPSVVRVYELGFDTDGRPFFTMEYVPGLRSDRALTLANREALGLAAVQLAIAIEALHAAGVVHGDLKPSNVLIVPGPVSGGPPAGIRLLDFGLARLMKDAATGHAGTPGFAAPELVRGEAPAPASDLYGLGAVLYTLASGRPPFAGTSVSATLRQQASGAPEGPLEDAGLPALFVRLVLRLLSERPAERGHDAREVRRELERIFPLARRPLRDRLQSTGPVGRGRELARIESWLANPDSRVRLQVVHGAPGMGNSGLLDEIASRAAISGRGVLRLSGRMPGGSAARILIRRLIGDAGASLPEETTWPKRLIAWLSSDHARLDDEDVPALAEAALVWLAKAGERAGAPLLFVDDSEALDPASRSLIRRLLLAPQPSALRAVWARHAVAPEGVEDERTLRAAGFAETVELGALGRDDVARLAGSRLGAPAPDRLVEWLWSRARGHPGFTVELLTHAANLGAIEEDESGARLDEDALTANIVPASFEASWFARWNGSPDAIREAAAALAAWNRPVPPETLRSAAPSADTQVVAALVQSGLARLDDQGRLEFSLPAIRERILQALEPARRRAIHESILEAGALPQTERFEHLRAAGRIDEALAAAREAVDERPDGTLALAAAALAEPIDREVAAAWYERAGRALFDHGRHFAAIAPFERALELDPSGASRHRVRVALVQTLFRAGAIARLEPWLALARADAPPPEQEIALELTAVGVLTLRGRYAEVVDRLTRVLAHPHTKNDAMVRALAALSLANAEHRMDRPDQARKAAEDAVAAYRSAGYERGALRAEGLRAQIVLGAGHEAEAERILNEAIGQALRQQHRLAIEELRAGRAALRIQAGRWGAAREDLDEALRLALEDGRTGSATLLTGARALLEGLSGRPRTALRLARSALRMSRSSPPASRSLAMRAAGLAHRVAGRRSSAERFLRRGLSLAGVPAEERDWTRFELGGVLFLAGRFDEVRALRRAEADETALGNAGEAALASLAGRAAVRLGDFEAAEREVRRAQDWLASRRHALVAALTQQLRAELVLARGLIRDGAAEARAALEAFEALPAPAERARAALDFARLCNGEDTDSRAPVSRWLEEAAGGFQRLGDLRSRERALALLVRRLKRTHPIEGRAGRAHDLIAAVRRLLDSLADVRELSQRAMQLAVEQLEAEHGVLLLYDESSGELTGMAEHGAVDAATRRNAAGYSRRVVERVARSGGAVLLGDAATDPESLSESIVDMHLRSILCVPLYLRGRVIGAVYLDDSRRADAFSDSDRALLEGFAQLMAVAFEKSRGHEEVERANRLLVGENIQLRLQAGVRFSTQNLVAASTEMRRVLSVVERVAHSDASVLLSGENGTGKELIALTLHHSGKRHDRPFVAVNCGALTESLLESELFGVLPRVATGVAGREGRFVEANGGTLFLDEIGDMPIQQQVALLRVLSTREVTPVGGGPPIPVDVRIIAASNRDLVERIASGAFREDLYHRLNVIPIEVPPLRDRKADIPALAHRFAAEFSQQHERGTPELSPELLAALMQSDWPGNVRALRNYIERIMAMNPGPVLVPVPLPRDLENPPLPRVTRGHDLASLVSELESRAISDALTRSGGNQTEAARALGLTEQSLRYRLRKYSMDRIRRKRRIRR